MCAKVTLFQFLLLIRYSKSITGYLSLYKRILICLIAKTMIKLFFNDTENDKTYHIICAPREDSDQHEVPRSLISVFTVGMRQLQVLGYPKSDGQKHDQATQLSIPRKQHHPNLHFLPSFILQKKSSI